LKLNSSAPLEILIVDDDRVVALLHKNQLRCSKIEPAPVICTNGREALDYLLKNDNPGNNFLILLDLNMPVVDGWKFLKKLRKNPPLASVYVVVVTSSINNTDYLKAQTYNLVIHFCRKPLSSQCVRTIKNLKQLQPFFKNEPKKTEDPEE
jgi:CheY-like chemotaxis protein